MATTPDAPAPLLAADPRYHALVARRGRYGWTLALVMLAVYLAFILVVAFDKPLLGTPIAGGATTLGIPVGLGIILFAILLTGLYVRRANREFDPEMAALVAEYRA